MNFLVQMCIYCHAIPASYPHGAAMSYDVSTMQPRSGNCDKNEQNSKYAKSYSYFNKVQACYSFWANFPSHLGANVHISSPHPSCWSLFVSRKGCSSITCAAVFPRRTKCRTVWIRYIWMVIYLTPLPAGYNSARNNTVYNTETLTNTFLYSIRRTCKPEPENQIQYNGIVFVLSPVDTNRLDWIGCKLTPSSTRP